MNNFIDYLYGTLITPRRTIALLAARHPVGAGISAFLITSVFSSLSALMGEDISNIGASGINLTSALPAIFLLCFILNFVFWMLGIGFLHLIAVLAGGEGTIKSLITTQGFAQLPCIFLTPFDFLGMIAGDWITVVASLACGIWSVILSIFAVKFSYGLPPGRSILVVFLPLIITICIVILVVVLFFVALWPLLGQMLQDVM